MEHIGQLVQDHPWFSGVILAVGAASLAQSAIKATLVVAQTFFLPGTSLKKYGAKKGAWAVVTGASDGIGAEFAFQLAKAGFNILLVARNQEKLNATKAEIDAKKYESVTVQTHVIDFAAGDDTAYAKLGQACAALDIGVLVNNVGKSHNFPAYFVDTPADEIRDIVEINVNATLRVTYAILPKMVKRKRGLILNIGSFSGAVPSPMLATYSGTKAFLTTFTAALADEVRKDKIDVQHVNTYFVVSKLSKIRRSNVMTPLPGPYVKSVLSTLNNPCGAAMTDRPATTTPYWSHAVLDYGIGLLRSLGGWNLAVKYTHNLHVDIRKRALRKQEREAKQQ